MWKLIISTTFLCLIATQTFSQSQRIVSLYLQGQYNKTLYDRTSQNNPEGVGIGLQAYLNTVSKFKPTIDFTADAYPAGEKVQLINPDGSNADDVGSMVNLFAGASYSPIPRLYISFVAGPSWMGNGQRLMAIKPSFGFHFSPTQRWTGKVSYIHVFNRDITTEEDFGSISLSLGVKLF